MSTECRYPPDPELHSATVVPFSTIPANLSGTPPVGGQKKATQPSSISVRKHAEAKKRDEETDPTKKTRNSARSRPYGCSDSFPERAKHRPPAPSRRQSRRTAPRRPSRIMFREVSALPLKNNDLSPPPRSTFRADNSPRPHPHPHLHSHRAHEVREPGTA